MAKAQFPSQLDVLVVGGHCCASVAAAVLRCDAPKLAVGHIALADEKPPDRLTMVNPKLLGLHPVLGGLARTVDWTETCGLQFLSPHPGTRGEYVAKSPTALVAPRRQITTAAAGVAGKHGVVQRTARTLTVTRVVDDGVELCIDGKSVLARTLVVAADLPPDARRTLGIAVRATALSPSRYHFLEFKAPKGVFKPPGSNTVPISCELNGSEDWGWVLSSGDTLHLGVLTDDPTKPGPAVVSNWIGNLVDHGLITNRPKLPDTAATITTPVPVAGALVGEVMANRTLLIGPAGGFVTACAEEVYPSCWSAVLAAEVVAKALKEPHVQDALCSYRTRCGSTVGDYLRGPQQNLQMLLPLVYRNSIMAARLGEAILTGESIVR